MRVGFVLRSTEIKPLFWDLFACWSLSRFHQCWTSLITPSYFILRPAYKLDLVRRPPARAIIISYCPGQFLRLLLFIISLHLSTDFTHSSFLGVVPLPHIRIALCLCLRISILPYCLMALCHCCIYTFLLLLLRLFLRTNVWRIDTYIPLFIIYYYYGPI